MKLGLIDIKKAYLGTTSITNSNAFVGTVPVIEGGGEDDRLRFVANAASSFYLSKKSSKQTVAQYSTDGINWTNIPTSSANAIQMASGDIVYIRGKLTGNNGFSDYSVFNGYSGGNGCFDIMGNIMYWYDYEQLELVTLTYEYAFKSLFYGLSSRLGSAANLILPATVLSNRCYMQMFDGCTSLTAAPELPATTLTENCYGAMFNGCTSLTAAPELPATTLTENCYGEMFKNCTNLSYIKCLATNISATNCLYNWVSGVSATGTFVKAASMSSWTTGTRGIPSGWTVQNA